MLNEAIKSEKDIPVLFNTGMRYLEYAPELTIKYAEGAQTAEVMRPLNYWSVLENVRLGASLKKISLCYLPPGPYESLATFSSLDIPIFGSTYVMHGGTPWAQRVECFLFDLTAAKTMKKFFDHLKNNSEIYYEAEPVKEIGLIYSRQTGYYYAKENRFEKLDSTFSGAFRSLIHGHRHFDCFYDTQLDWDRIKDYRALILPNVACLSDTHIDLLKRFVMEGGGLVATYETSLFDEHGCRRDDFGLSELFGVTYSCGPLKDHYRRREYRQAGPKMGYSLIPETYFKWNVKNPIAKDMDLNHLIPVSDAVVLQQERRPPEYVVAKSNDEAWVVADLFLPAGGSYGKPFDFPLGNPPGVVTHRFGKGQVVYFAAPLEKHYLRRGLAELRQLFINAVDFVCGGKPLLNIKAPPGVVANLTSAPGRYYLHLINYCGTMHESSYPVEWVAPIKEIPVQLLLEPKITIKSVKMLNEDRTLDFQHLETYLKFIVPHLGIFDTVIIEYA
jgi:hypothetical protein